MKPKIATHITKEVHETTKAMIIEEARDMTEAEITAKCQELMVEAGNFYDKAITDKAIQDSRDHMYIRWGDELSEMATIWSTVKSGEE
jgi:hypothetical protein